MYTRMASHGKIGGLETKNRLVMSPMGIGLAELDGSPGPDMIEYYEARARGGAGIVIPEITRVNDVHGVGLMRQLSVTKDRHIAPLAELAAAIHRHGSKIFIQLHHPGRETYSSLIGGQPVVAPSAIPCGLTRQETRALDTAEVKALVRDFVDGAVQVQRAGCDGVELHGAHGYLINQFLSPYTNKRDDEYGGSFENRMRFVTEIIQGIRAACGDGFPLGVRLSVDEKLSANGVTEPYIDLDEGVRISRALEALGIDFIDVSCAIYETGIFSIEPISFPQAWRRDMLEAVKRVVSIPVIGVGVIREPATGETLLEDGVIDFVSMGRSWLADEQWGNKALQGRERELRKCIACLRCFESLSEYNGAGVPAECAVNPRCARERKYGEPVCDAGSHSAVVVGAGPAGMSAAHTLAERGVKVTLLEARDRLGGQLDIAKAPPLKERMQWVADYYAYELERLGVDVRLNTRATPELVDSLNPDGVVVATGGEAIVPKTIPGVDGPNVYSVNDVLEGRAALSGKRVAVIGAGMTGIETAEFLAERGNRITLVEMLDTVAPDAYRTLVLDVMNRLKQHDPEILLGHALKAIGPDGILVEAVASKSEKTVPVDAVVLSLGFRPDNKLAEALGDRPYPVHVIGDACRVAKIAPAVRSGFEIGRALFKARTAPSFIMPADDLKDFVKVSCMGDQEGLYMAYLTDPEAVAGILPAPLKPFSMPVVTLSVTHIRKPSFATDYFETILAVYCTHGQTLGAYCVALLLGGPGQEMATQLGRDYCGLPKKLGAEFAINKTGDLVTASVARKGVQLIDARMELGETNHPMFNVFNKFPEPGKQNMGTSFYFMFDYDEAGDGMAFSNVRLVGNQVRTDYHSWAPGHTSLALASSPDDPWAELPINTVIGGAYAHNDLYMLDRTVLDRPDTMSTVPMLMKARYDRSALG